MACVEANKQMLKRNFGMEIFLIGVMQRYRAKMYEAAELPTVVSPLLQPSTSSFHNYNSITPQHYDEDDPDGLVD